ncbi:hypothetical protein BS47DRAFT_1367650 [Hydnum rufescens UP504]|uniref:DUF6532 domain-containing protein n=1 Tax=Hydnum rufescens UP504 TaxID=1448309 RepID=A0A9P6DKA3_9AGAM|nr:hypothetical protein BS47DRAFT_1367650 [Hydnum rufescens UP504]
MSEQDMLVNNAFAIACHDNPSIPSFKKSAEFHKNIMASHSHFHNHFKQAAQKLVPLFYGLVNVPQKDVKGKVALALAKGNYHAKTFGKIKAVLTEHEDGQSVPAEFSTKAWAKHYDSEVDSWNLWAMKDIAHIQTSHNVLMALNKLAG